MIPLGAILSQIHQDQDRPRFLQRGIGRPRFLQQDTDRPRLLFFRRSMTPDMSDPDCLRRQELEKEREEIERREEELDRELGQTDSEEKELEGKRILTSDSKPKFNV